ncbi:replicative DNA helicase [Bacillus pseudomycoides]|uniref:Replicative DNA helicase n=1 Tax=Bacillus pseudomycoides TaxID=64104 RepID=A0A2B5RGQ6_9BACI|nr:replicative DNA helicase [Bacillus pseudomycoides]PDY45266.1 replicative DNA helicase [Bacillus pseudomycoides]PEA82383.1 replicative DNA helicase [Bacillus pseudomycoides]PED71305.1 replicative DNA helicase [Bacillus pseudomycoides]PEI40604.1 replicative DNA helicase [Bacillus pseudomycoides]PEJ79972.1 replicative DNA helicase [Bacillus pseudomycoides]
MSIQNIEAEQTVLGSLLREGELIKECRLTEQHFSTAMHRAIFKLIREIEEDGQPIDLVALVSKMDPVFLKQVGGIEYFVNIIESVPTTANFLYYEGLVRSAWKMNQAGSVAHSMCERLLAEKDERVIGEAITRLCELEEVDCTLDFDLKDTLVDLYEELHQDTEELTGIETGFSALNKMTCGLQEGDFVVVGARPSMGKTAFALNIALHAAKSGTAVGLFSLEMSNKQLLKRMVSCLGEVSGKRLKNPKHRFTIEDWGTTSRAFAEIGDLSLEIYDKAGVTTQEIWVQVRKLKRKYGDKKLLVIIDYLQLITGDSKYRGNRFQEMSEISRKLKLMARDLNVCVIALSQLSRGVESRQDKRPLLSDLRETGQIEQDADVIMLMYRDDYYDKETENKDVTEIQIAKHRNGPIGGMKLRFLKEFGKFVEDG